MESAITVADEMLRIAKSKSASLTPLQLMKLVYISHGWHLALIGSDLFDDRIEAWKYGPVIPDLYRATKHFGKSEIPLDLISDVTMVAPKTRKFLEDVYSKYGELSGVQLSALTHKSGTPWDQVYRDGEQNIEIPDNIIKKHYQELARARQESAAAA